MAKPPPSLLSASSLGVGSASFSNGDSWSGFESAGQALVSMAKGTIRVIKEIFNATAEVPKPPVSKTKRVNPDPIVFRPCVHLEGSTPAIDNLLPSEMWTEILSHLSVQEFVTMSKSCRGFHVFALADEMWKYFCLRDFQVTEKLENLTWHRTYYDLYSFSDFVGVFHEYWPSSLSVWLNFLRVFVENGRVKIACRASKSNWTISHVQIVNNAHTQSISYKCKSTTMDLDYLVTKDKEVRGLLHAVVTSKGNPHATIQMIRRDVGFEDLVPHNAQILEGIDDESTLHELMVTCESVSGKYQRKNSI